MGKKGLVGSNSEAHRLLTGSSSSFFTYEFFGSKESFASSGIFGAIFAPSSGVVYCHYSLKEGFLRLLVNKDQENRGEMLDLHSHPSLRGAASGGYAEETYGRLLLE
ncbi:hypothetical protein D8674_031014 [Pyrus ussuriensis x Pyrus communis]|uniref:Uncharacterized protein n=1 Tax=Pyrus ussuriensis x Pyrus communis TaxID=2448454 RepID=A0A5N5FAM2_9ROSA|nr:hypothetical protein D8674_031014 [Pyrus ussuriensis x Pyrus communis]